MHNYLVFCLIFISTFSYSRSEEISPPAPVIIIPGDLSSPINARLNKLTSRSDCPRKSDWYRLWLNIEDFLPKRFPCMVENLQLVFDPTTGTSHNQYGVETKVPGWGTAHVVEYVDDSYLARLFHVAYDASGLVQEMVKWGYKRDISIRGAPYDFRYAMASQPNIFERIRLLVEDTYHKNHNRKVSLISHSLGGLFTTWFLNHRSAEWKEKYIHSFISLATPWGGANKALLASTSGYNMGIPTVRPIAARELQRTIETNYMLLPDHRFFEPGKIFIRTPVYNYTMKPDDIKLYFKHSNNTMGHLIYLKVSRENHGEDMMPKHPGVKTYCIYGRGFDTPGSFQYSENFPDAYPHIEYSDGDGSACYESLSGCKQWMKAEGQNTEVHEFNEVSHLKVFSSELVQEKIKSILFHD